MKSFSILINLEVVRGVRRKCVSLRRLLRIIIFLFWGFTGDIFTWSNKHKSDTFTKERLDRAVANSNWVEMFDLVTVEPLVTKML